MISLADDLKAAATDALKKAATLLGVGLHLYAGAKPSHPNPTQSNTTNNRPANSGNGGNGGNGGDGSGNQQGSNGNGRISAKQHKFILDLITSKGMTKSQLNQHCTQIYGSVVDNKTAAKSKSQSAVDDDMQFSAYAYLCASCLLYTSPSPRDRS